MCSYLESKYFPIRFRFLNEQLYRQEGSASASLFKNDPTLFESYHAGQALCHVWISHYSDDPRYRIQANQWPLDPLDLIIAEVKKLPKKAVVADFGCGEARLAQSVHRATVHSFDLVAANDKVAKFLNLAAYLSLIMAMEFSTRLWLVIWPMFRWSLAPLMWLSFALLSWERTQGIHF